MHGDDQNGELEKAAVQSRAKSQSLAYRRPVFAQSGKMQKRIEGSREMPLGVDKRGALGGARSRGDGVVKLLLLGRELPSIDIR